jgi:excisionase family DNA binding protein
MKLLIQYDNAELTTGQVAEKLGISKSEVLELLKKHKIPYVRADEEYLEQEFKTIQKYIK